MTVDLTRTHAAGYAPGRSYVVRTIWFAVSAACFANGLIVSYRFKRWLLRRFGARVGRGVIIKPRVTIKYPWRLSVGDDCWIGEGAWLDNMEDVKLGNHVVISQGAYLCTGNHDWSDPGMPLSPRPIHVRDGAWVGAFARVAPGVTVAEGSVVALGGVLLADSQPWGVYVGNPAVRVTTRVVREPSSHG
jgi:putative colanic acid biosynthesis acetyltransferase WcaF